MTLRFRALAGVVPLVGLLGCAEPFDAPPLDVSRTSDTDDLEEVTQPTPDDGAGIERPTCSYYLLRQDDGRVAFAVDVEGTAWSHIALWVEDEHNSWGLLMEEIGPSIAVPFELDGYWSVEATVYTDDGHAWPCGSTSVLPPR